MVSPKSKTRQFILFPVVPLEILPILVLFKFYACFSFLQQWQAVLKHLESIYHTLSDFDTRILRPRATLSSTQSIDDIHHPRASGALATLAYLWSPPTPYLQNSKEWLKMTTLDLFIKLMHSAFTNPGMPPPPILFHIMRKIKEIKAKHSLLFFFFVMVPATCLLFIFSITCKSKEFG